MVAFKRAFSLLLILLVSFAVSACKSDKVKIELYTSDIKAASEGKLYEVPTEISFTLLGKDDNTVLDQVTEIAKKIFSRR